MFGAIGRFIRAIGYFFTGKVDSATKDISKDPYTVQATFSSIIKDKTNRIHQYKEAVAGLIAQQEKKMATLKRLNEEVGRLERLKQGAAAKAKAKVEALQKQGMAVDKIKADEEYLSCQAAYHDFTSSLAEKTERIAELEHDVEGFGDSIKDHKVQLQSLLRELDKVKVEAKETVADMITSREESEIADMISGISEDRSAKELETMRELRAETKAEARISRELSGTDTARSEAEFLEYARTSAISSEFDVLIGLAEEADQDGGDAETESQEGTKLPEN